MAEQKAKKKRRKKEKIGDKARHFLVDIGFETEKQFLTALLQAGQFTGAMLGRIGGAGPTKGLRASAAADCLLADEALMDLLMAEYCAQPRQWLLLQTGELADVFPQRAMKSARSFFTDKQASGWHGPFGNDGDERQWYVYVRRMPNRLVTSEGDLIRDAPIRWDLVAEVTPTYMALHWNGFSTAQEGHTTTLQFPYWQHIPAVIASLRKAFGDADWQDINLQKIVLHELMPRLDVDGGRWHHRRIRAQRGSVAFSASGGKTDASGSVSLEEQSGVRRLTAQLARSAARTLQIKDKATIAQIERGLLHTIVKDTGARAYEFELDPPGELSVRMHCYFGAAAMAEGESSNGADAFQHVRCFFRHRGSFGARDYMLQHLKL